MNNVQAIKTKLMELVLHLDPDSAEVMLALAELTGEAAATLDRLEAPMGFEARMQVFVEEAKRAYIVKMIHIKAPQVIVRLGG